MPTSRPTTISRKKLQWAAYSQAINDIYQPQLPNPVVRTSLLFAHPEEGKPVTVVSTEGDELLEYQQQWMDILGAWYSEHGDDVAQEQARFQGEKARPF